jgi:hypothetical protein
MDQNVEMETLRTKQVKTAARLAKARAARKPLETIKAYLQSGMSLTDAAKITGYPVSSLSIMALCWNIKLPQGRPKQGTRVVAQ